MRPNATKLIRMLSPNRAREFMTLLQFYVSSRWLAAARPKLGSPYGCPGDMGADPIYAPRTLPRGCLEQILDLSVQILGNRERQLTTVRRKEARHRVIRQVHAIRALVNENRHGRIRRRIGSRLHHLFHDERIADEEAKTSRRLSTSVLLEDLADIETD